MSGETAADGALGGAVDDAVTAQQHPRVLAQAVTSQAAARTLGTRA